MTGPSEQVWPPHTEEQLSRAAASGILVESHRLDLKRELKGGDSGNKEIAKDIAAFSQDGGIILVGVGEGTPPTLCPVDLAGLSERIEQVGLSRVDEPVPVTTREIPSANEPGRGYLVVEIPASPRPPHMADGKYYARGDKTNHPLSNAEVLRLHERLIEQNKDITQEAYQTIERAVGGGNHAVMAVLAKPLGAPEDLLMPLLVSDSRRADVVQLVNTAGFGPHQQFALSLSNPVGVITRPGAVAATSFTGNGRFEATPKHAEVRLHESGAITLLSGRTVDMYSSWGEAAPRVMESIVVGQVDLVVRLAAQVAKYGFSGSWRFGLAVGGLDGANSFALATVHTYDGQMPVYTEPTYDRAVTASLAELEQSPHTVVRKLVGQLLRSLESVHQFPWIFE